MRQEVQLLLRLWKDWCRVWPEQYGHDSLQVNAEGYDPVTDLIPTQAYKDFYFEVVRSHPQLKHLNVFEVVDTVLNPPQPIAIKRVNSQVDERPQDAKVVPFQPRRRDDETLVTDKADIA